MALDTSTLESAIQSAFKKAKDTPPPADASKAGAVQDQILAKLAQDLGAAIEAFVKSADVVDVAVQVTNPAQQVIGSGTQTHPGKLQ